MYPSYKIECDRGLGICFDPATPNCRIMQVSVHIISGIRIKVVWTLRLERAPPMGELVTHHKLIRSKL